MQDFKKKPNFVIVNGVQQPLDATIAEKVLHELEHADLAQTSPATLDTALEIVRLGFGATGAVDEELERRIAAAQARAYGRVGLSLLAAYSADDAPVFHDIEEEGMQPLRKMLQQSDLPQNDTLAQLQRQAEDNLHYVRAESSLDWLENPLQIADTLKLATVPTDFLPCAEQVDGLKAEIRQDFFAAGTALTRRLDARIEQAGLKANRHLGEAMIAALETDYMLRGEITHLITSPQAVAGMAAAAASHFAALGELDAAKQAQIAAAAQGCNIRTGKAMLHGLATPATLPGHQAIEREFKELGVQATRAFLTAGGMPAQEADRRIADARKIATALTPQRNADPFSRTSKPSGPAN